MAPFHLAECQGIKPGTNVLVIPSTKGVPVCKFRPPRYESSLCYWLKKGNSHWEVLTLFVNDEIKKIHVLTWKNVIEKQTFQLSADSDMPSDWDVFCVPFFRALRIYNVTLAPRITSPIQYKGSLYVLVPSPSL